VVLAAACAVAMGQTAADATKPPALDQKPLALDQQIAALVSQPAVARAHWGVVVTTLDGRPIYALNDAQLFQPDSNAKLFTTAAAIALLGQQDSFGIQTEVIGKGVFRGEKSLEGDLVLVGDGDAYLSGRTMPYDSPTARPNGATPATDSLRYLSDMADQVAATGLKKVKGDVVGDDTLFPWEPYPEDWSIDDTIWGYGAPVSALTVNDNQIKVTVTPGLVEGKPATVTIDPAMPYFTLDTSRLTTGAKKSGNHVQFERPPGSKILRIYGSIAVDEKPDDEEAAIDDPAEYAAMAFKGMLEARGITVTGIAHAQHRAPDDATGFLTESHAPINDVMNATQNWRVHGQKWLDFVPTCAGCEGSIPPGPKDPVEKVLANHKAPTLREDIVLTNKVSQNLHAELLLHQLAAAVGTGGSTAQGARVLRAFLLNAGIDKDDFVFYDGSGLSSYDLVTPRAIAKLLSYAAHDPKTGAPQPWFAAWKASLPVGGVDGTLADRFTTAPLKGHVFAKTGTHSEGRALSGYLDCASGQTVIFSILVGNHLPGDDADRDAMDKIVAAIAAAE